MSAEPFIYIANLRIDEPVTVLTDLLVAGICFFAFVQIMRYYASSKERFYYSCFYLGLGIGTALGGLLGHAFLYALHPAWQLPGWVISMAATSFIVMGSLESNRESLHPWLVYAMIVLNISIFLAFSIMVILYIDFVYVVIQIAFSLLVLLLAIQIIGWQTRRQPGHLWFSGAIGIMIIAAIVFIQKLGINNWIDHNGISHSLIAVSVLFFFFGIRMFLNYHQTSKP